MPNPVLKFVTIFDSSEGYGWSEIHYKQANVASPPLDQALNLFLAGPVATRAVLLGENCAIVGARVSYPVVNGIASYGTRAKTAGTLDQPSSAPAVSLAVNFKNTNFTKTSITHLRGFWDAVESDESYRPDLAPGWQERFEAWKNSLIQGGYGWLSKDPTLSTKGNVQSYAVGTDQRVTFTLAAPGIVTAFPLGRAEVRFSGFHYRHSILNRAILCEWVDALTLKSVQPIGANPQTSTGKFNYRATSFVGYASTASISLGERRMGKALNRYPGRARAQVLN